MTEKDKIALRKPLAPKTDDADCKIAHEELLKEYAELKEWKVDGIDHVSGSDKEHVVSLEQYNARVGEYAKRRDAYNENYAGQIETMEDVKANIRELKAKMAVAREEGDKQQKAFDAKWGDQIPSPFPEDVDLMFNNPDEWKRQSELCEKQYDSFTADQEKVSASLDEFFSLFRSCCEEESKFEEIQKAADEAFEYVAKHMLADGSGRMLTDEELEEREKRKGNDHV